MPRSKTITGDAQQVQALLAWAKSNGVEMTRVTVGSCTVDVTQSRAAPSKRTVKPERQAIYAQFGGEAFREAQETGELEPVVGRR